MRAISLWQPWASAIACGAKTIETRHWSTDYRGPLAIHAAKHWESGLSQMIMDKECRAALNNGNWMHCPKMYLPFGAVVAVCTLVDCMRTEDVRGIDEQRFSHSGMAWTERYWGDYHPGRFAWILRDIQKLKTPLPWKGGQSFFTVPDHLIQEAMQ